MAQQFNGKQHFVTQHHDALPDACFISTNSQVLLRGFPLQDYFSALFATYDGGDDIIKTMIAKLTTINLLTDEHVLKQRVNNLRTFLTNKVATFDPSLPSAPQVILWTTK